jgi:predicted MFS family arabinose efflux permease
MASATGLSILVAAFAEGKERNRALSVFSAATGSGFAAGMILGGAITATLGWRWVFDINVPIGVAVSFLSIKYISSTIGGQIYENRQRHLDIFGAISITAGLMLLVYSLNSAQNIGIGSPETLELLLSSVIVLAAFLLIEYRSKAPLMPLGFLRRSSIFGANTLGLLQVAAFVAMVFILTNYLQQVRGYSALSAGLAFIPMGVVFLVISAFLSERLVNRFGVKTNHNFGDGFADNRLSVPFSDISHRKLLWWVARTDASQWVWNWIRLHCNQHSRTYGRGEEGLASGLINTSRQIGGPIGLVVLMTVANFEIPGQTGQLVIQSATAATAMVTGFGYAFLAAALLTVIGIIFTALLIQERQHRRAR